MSDDSPATRIYADEGNSYPDVQRPVRGAGLSCMCGYRHVGASHDKPAAANEPQLPAPWAT